MQISNAIQRKRERPLQANLLGVISANLRQLRKLGLTSADLLALEKLAILCAKGAGIVRPSALGRLLGIGRAGAHYRLGRLCGLGVAVRVGRAVALNVRGLLSMAADAVKARACHLERLKALIHWTKRPKRSGPATHTRQEERKGDEIGPLDDWRVGDRGPDGRKIVGQRLFGALTVPIWG